MKRLFYLLLIGLVTANAPSHATHILGGELTYRCLGGGNFEFTAVIYRDCAGIHFPFTMLTLSGPVGGVLRLASANDLSPRCHTNLTYSCNPVDTGAGPPGAVSRLVYQGIVNLNQLLPTPSQGYTWHVILPCCRPGLGNVSASDMGLFVRMYPYTHPNTGYRLTPSELCDDAPVFLAEPTVLAILNPYDTIHLQHMAGDPDLGDSLVYSIDYLRTRLLVTVPYNTGYSLSNPIPGLLGPPHVAAANTPINPATGELVIRPTQAGTFATVVKVTAYRNRQRIAEVIRDFAHKVVLNPGTSVPPYMPPNFPAHFFSQRAPCINSSYWSMTNQAWEAEYYLGDTLVIPLQALDVFPSLSGDPNNPASWLPTANAVSLAVSGLQLSSINQSDSGCLQPPCATVRASNDPLPPAAPVDSAVQVFRGNGIALGYGFNGVIQTGAKIVWATEIDTVIVPGQAGSGYTGQHHSFMVTAIDRNCPLEGETRQALTVKLRPLPTLPRPLFDTITHANGLNTLHFRITIDSTNLDPLDVANFVGTLTAQDSAVLSAKALQRRLLSFHALNIYKSVARHGPYQRLATIKNLAETSWTDTSQAPGGFFFLELLSSNPLQSTYSQDTLVQCIPSLFSILSGPNQYVCPNIGGLLFPSVRSPNYTYQWYFNGQQIPGATAVQCTAWDAGTYEVHVVDTVTGCSSRSSQKSMQWAPPVFDASTICRVTQDPTTGLTRIFYNKTPNVNIARYIIFRELNIAGIYLPVGARTSNDPGWFIDSGAITLGTPRRYQIAAEDHCGIISSKSPAHQAIYLQHSLNSDSSSLLTWTTYQGAVTSNYYVYRGRGGFFQEIGRVSLGSNSFVDYARPAGPVNYLVRGFINGPCGSGLNNPGVNDVSSNVVSHGIGTSAPTISRPTIRTYPNPNSGKLMVEGTVVPDALVLRDLLGRIVRRVQPTAILTEMDLTDLAAGTYLLEFQSGGQVWVERILLQHPR